MIDKAIQKKQIIKGGGAGENYKNSSKAYILCNSTIVKF